MSVYVIKRFSAEDYFRKSWENAKKEATDAIIIEEGSEVIKKGSKFGKYGKLAAAGVGIGLAAGLGKKAYDKKKKQNEEKKFSNISYVLKRRNFSTAVLNEKTGEIMNSANHAANSLASKDASYYANLGKEWGTTSTADLVKKGSQSRVGSFQADRTLGGVESYKKVNSVATGKQAYQMGQNSVGVMGGMRNTWSRMGTMGKVGTVAAGAAVAGLAMKGLFGGKKKESNYSNTSVETKRYDYEVMSETGRPTVTKESFDWRKDSDALKNAERDYHHAHKSGNKEAIQKAARKYLDQWTTDVYIPARKEGILVDLSPSIIDEANGRFK